MKSLYTYILSCLLLFLFTELRAQETAVPNHSGTYRNFDHLPSRSSAKKEQLQRLFASEKNSEVTLDLHDGVKVVGIIEDKVIETNGTIRLNVIAPAYPQTVFNFSAISNQGKSYTYRSRIINRSSGEVLLLNEENDRYYFRKLKKDKLIAE